ncbi:hypothetical protein CHS0354_005344 [Potamilus streckersoni]|uniref:F5/8 type C domain-containing protein n=1 Tax=Potamilus streckersoni TaxID=2493646 RepID=A0AAE0SGE6_9BIVA|nr:hypothetical protein CHS0354_005344 [Potamilus streckersoni]
MTGIRNFALNKFAHQSSTIVFNGFKWTADKAVDGNTTGSNPEQSRTCSATHNSLGNHTWEVDIGFQIMVMTITVYGRVNDVSIPDYQLSGFQVFVGNSSNPWTSGPPLAKQQSSKKKTRLRIYQLCWPLCLSCAMEPDHHDSMRSHGRWRYVAMYIGNHE